MTGTTVDGQRLIFAGKQLEDENTLKYYFKLIENLYIPQEIKKDKYVITKISENSFRNSKTIKSIRFSSNSKIKTIEKCAFSDSLIVNLSIPASLLELKEGWCYITPYLTNIVIHPNKSSFIYLDDKLILYKSNPKSDIYDIKKIEPFAFADSKIKYLYIPSNVNEIGERAFSSCKNLHNVKISSNSQIKTIEDNVFTDSPIDETIIHTHIEYPKK